MSSERLTELDISLDRALNDLLSNGAGSAIEGNNTDTELESLLRTARAIGAAPRVMPSHEFKAGARTRMLNLIKAEGSPAAAAHTSSHETHSHASPHLARFWRLAAAVAVVLVLVGGTGAVAAGAEPDDPLYGMKLTMEQARAFFTFSDEDRVELRLGFAEQRSQEMLAMLGIEREDLAQQSAVRMQEELTAAQQNATSLKWSVADWSAMETTFAAQQRLLEEVMSRESISEQTRLAAGNALGALARTREEFARRTRAEGTTPEDGTPGPGNPGIYNGPGAQPTLTHGGIPTGTRTPTGGQGITATVRPTGTTEPGRYGNPYASATPEPTDPQRRQQGPDFTPTCTPSPIGDQNEDQNRNYGPQSSPTTQPSGTQPSGEPQAGQPTPTPGEAVPTNTPRPDRGNEPEPGGQSTPTSGGQSTPAPQPQGAPTPTGPKDGNR